MVALGLALLSGTLMTSPVLAYPQHPQHDDGVALGGRAEAGLGDSAQFNGPGAIPGDVQGSPIPNLAVDDFGLEAWAPSTLRGSPTRSPVTSWIKVPRGTAPEDKYDLGHTSQDGDEDEDERNDDSFQGLLASMYDESMGDLIYQTIGRAIRAILVESPDRVFRIKNGLKGKSRSVIGDVLFEPLRELYPRTVVHVLLELILKYDHKFVNWLKEFPGTWAPGCHGPFCPLPPGSVPQPPITQPLPPGGEKKMVEGVKERHQQVRTFWEEADDKYAEVIWAVWQGEYGLEMKEEYIIQLLRSPELLLKGQRAIRTAMDAFDEKDTQEVMKSLMLDLINLNVDLAELKQAPKQSIKGATEKGAGYSIW